MSKPTPEQEVHNNLRRATLANEHALAIIGQYGGFDGGHHKQWVLDQAVRALTLCPTVVRTALDVNGSKYTYDALGESDAYRAWVRKHNAGEDGPDTYAWDVGIPP